MRDGERVGPWWFERRALLKAATAGDLLAVL